MALLMASVWALGAAPHTVWGGAGTVPILRRCDRRGNRTVKIGAYMTCIKCGAKARMFSNYCQLCWDAQRTVKD